MTEAADAEDLELPEADDACGPGVHRDVAAQARGRRRGACECRRRRARWCRGCRMGTGQSILYDPSARRDVAPRLLLFSLPALRSAGLARPLLGVKPDNQQRIEPLPQGCGWIRGAPLTALRAPDTVESMRIDLLKRLLAVPSRSRREEQMAAFLTAYVKAGGERRRGRCWSDELNNVYVLKGNTGFFPCVAAHIDTVHPMRQVQIVEQEGMLVDFDEHAQRTGIGADDKAGVFICLELLERMDNLAVALFAAEEVCGRGAYAADPAFFETAGYVLEFDGPARGLVSYSAGGVRLFQNDGEFIRRALPVLKQHGATKWQRHPHTDVMALRERFSFSCMNLSAGYHQWHTDLDFVKLDDVAASLALAMELIPVLGACRYDYDASELEAAEPPVPVTGLLLPEETRPSSTRL